MPALKLTKPSCITVVPLGQVRAEAHAVGVGDPHAGRHDVVGHARELVDAEDLERLAGGPHAALDGRDGHRVDGAVAGPGDVVEHAEDARRGWRRAGGSAGARAGAAAGRRRRRRPAGRRARRSTSRSARSRPCGSRRSRAARWFWCPARPTHRVAARGSRRRARGRRPGWPRRSLRRRCRSSPREPSVDRRALSRRRRSRPARGRAGRACRAGWRRGVLTVGSATTSAAAISAFDSPPAISCRTSRSRSVSSASAPSVARRRAAGRRWATRSSSRRVTAGGEHRVAVGHRLARRRRAPARGTSLVRKPLAPARSASTMYSSRPNVVRTRTRWRGSRRVASMPSMPGMRMSIRITSGRCCSAARDRLLAVARLGDDLDRARSPRARS